MTMSDTSGDLLDPSRLADIVDGDIELEADFVDLYLRVAAEHLVEMRARLTDGRDWSGAAHALKGASLNLGAVRVGRLAQTAEHAPPSAECLAELSAALEATRGAFAARTSYNHQSK
ncbi:MAG: Hpt domain-containing protein [Geminicoccaceae bacterium]|nr:Hpt domain-containing protein [Geminicoccaceae bacterium]